MARTISHRLFVILGLILVSGCTSIERLALPEPALADAYWERHDAASTDVIDHESWQTFLDRYVSTDTAGVNRVDYGAVNAGDQAELKRYLADLEAVPIHQYRRTEQMAYWVNLYNAKTVDIVVGSLSRRLHPGYQARRWSNRRWPMARARPPRFRPSDIAE